MVATKLYLNLLANVSCVENVGRKTYIYLWKELSAVLLKRHSSPIT